MVKRAIKNAIKILQNPLGEFEVIHKRTFEQALRDYLHLLTAIGFISAIISFLFSFGKAFYYDKFLLTDVNYIDMLNYTFGRSISIMFFYFFAGTFLIIILSILFNLFVKKLKYVQLLMIMFYSMTPVLLFSWVPNSVIALFIWTIFIFVTGMKHNQFGKSIKKTSINQRD